jgi:hypothetical protein
MKIYSYISALLIAGIASFSSCSQEEDVKEMNGDNSSSGLQISVSDGGYFDTTPGTRAIEKGYATEFTEGDEIGIFGVDANGIVENINNRKCMMTADGNWKIDGEQIKYNGAEFKQMKFYAYYPYDVNVKFNVTEGDPFAEYISEWTLGNDQSGEKYTKYDLMTSSSSAVVDNRFKGEINFKMQHCMALAVLKMPNLVYNFINGSVTIDDYEIPISNASFKLNNEEVTPYYQKGTGAYRFLVKPGEEFKIEATYTGVKEMTCTASTTLNSGTAKEYKVTDTNKKEHTLAVGDYYCADGSLVSKDAEIVPNNVIGIVCYVGNIQPSEASSENEIKDALLRDYSNCTHGLVVAVNYAEYNNSKTSVFSPNSRDYFYGDWFKTDEEWKDKFFNSDDVLTSSATDLATFASTLPFLGYNNTELMLMSPSRANACEAAANYVEEYRKNVESPSTVSAWFAPSLRELHVLFTEISTINAQLKKVNGDELKAGDRHWSTNERNRNTQIVYQHNLSTGVILDKRRNEGAGYFRMMLAF